MMTFEEIGRYLDKLELEKKFNVMASIVEDVLKPRIPPSPDNLVWRTCSPKVNYQCIQLTKNNAQSIRTWLEGECGFFEATIKDFGLDTDFGHIKWNEWIVLEPNSAVVFYTEDGFKNSFNNS